MSTQAERAARWNIDLERLQLMESFFNDLNEFMCARHGYKKHKCLPWAHKVDAHCSKFSLTLGFFRHDNSVGISSIRFKEKRSGHCSALIEFIDKISHIYCIPCIEFVSVQTEAMRSFVAKNQFINRDGYFSPSANQEIPSLDWYRKTPFGLK